jgi:hypothetical protein
MSRNSNAVRGNARESWGGIAPRSKIASVRLIELADGNIVMEHQGLKVDAKRIEEVGS